jgi:type IV secretion system protein VirB4
MINLARLFKDYNDAGALNEYLNLYGFVADSVFLTKSGDLGAVVLVGGIDHECLDQSTLDNVTRRFKAAMRCFGESYRICQYLFKCNNETIANRLYDSELVNQAIKNRSEYLASRADELYSIRIYYVVLCQGFRHKPSLTRGFTRLFTQPSRGLKEMAGTFSTRQQVALIESELDGAIATLLHQVESFIAQVSDLCSLTLLHKDKAFRVLKRLLNFAPHRIHSARRKHNAFLDYYLPDSTLECHRGHLLIDDYFVKVLTLKEPSSQSFPLIFKQILEVEASFILCTEWHLEDTSKIQKSIQSRRRHYLLVDDSKESLIQELGEANKEIVIQGHTFGEFSLTVVLYDRDLPRIDHAISSFSKIFSTVDAVLIDERYNLLNAFRAVVPGNCQLNLRRMAF